MTIWLQNRVQFLQQAACAGLLPPITKLQRKQSKLWKYTYGRKKNKDLGADRWSKNQEPRLHGTSHIIVENVEMLRESWSSMNRGCKNDWHGNWKTYNYIRTGVLMLMRLNGSRSLLHNLLLYFLWRWWSHTQCRRSRSSSRRVRM